MNIRHAAQDIATVKHLLTGAETEARRAGDSLPGAEHLLLAALALPDGSARRAFVRVGADPDRFRAAIDETHIGALRGIGIVAHDEVARPPSGTAAAATGVLRTNASAQEAFHGAVQLSKATKPARLRAAHVVMAVCRMEHGTAARVLHSLGIDRTELAAAAEQELGVDQ